MAHVPSVIRVDAEYRTTREHCGVRVRVADDEHQLVIARPQRRREIHLDRELPRLGVVRSRRDRLLIKEDPNVPEPLDGQLSPIQRAGYVESLSEEAELFLSWPPHVRESIWISDPSSPPPPPPPRSTRRGGGARAGPRPGGRRSGPGT